MKPAIHYAFEAKLIKRKKEDGAFEFIEVFKDFFDDEPIKAREAAFRHYQNYIDVLLESKGLKYESDKQARDALESFYDPKTNTKVEDFGTKLNMPDSWGNGIGVFMIIDEEFDKSDYSDTKEMIHGFGNLWEGNSSPESFTLSLEREVMYYQHFKYNTGDYISEIEFCNSDEWEEGYREDEPSKYTILKTPFDWTGMEKPYWWGEPKEEVREVKIPPTYEELIENGETNQVEFKPALLYNFKTKSAGISIKGIIAKSICAFLNSKGGFLFIGIDDNGQIQGLKYDFNLAADKNPKDFFRLEFDDAVKQFLPLSAKEKISGEFIQINGSEIFVVIVFPSKSRPIFLNGQHGKEFWVRWTASTRQYQDIEDITTYCLEHWGRKD